MKRIAIYSRKSVLSDTGESTKVQIKLCKNYFFNVECEFIEIIDEGFSGGNTNRPGFKKLMRLVENKEIDIVAVYKIDRIARNIVDFFSIYKEFEKHDVKLVSITEGFDASTPSGIMMMTMLAGVSEMERMNIKQRVKDNMKEIALKGKWSGGNPPLGYESIRVVEEGKKCSYLKLKDNDEPKIIKDIYTLFSEGYSARKIATIINYKYNLSTSQKRICNILYSPIYTPSSELINNYLKQNNYEISTKPNGYGYLTYQKTKTDKKGNKVLDKENKTIAAASMHEAIISNDLWLDVQEKLKKVTQDPKPRKSQFTFLAHLVKCGYCGKSMNVYSEPRKVGAQRFFRKTCTCDYKNSRRLTISLAEERFINAIKSINDINVISNIVFNRSDSSIKDTNKELEFKNKKISDLDKKIEGLAEKLSLAEGSVVNIILNQLEKMAKEKDLLEKDLLELQKKSVSSKNNKKNAILIKESIDKLILLCEKNSISKSEINRNVEKIFDSVYWFPIEKELKLSIKDM